MQIFEFLHYNEKEITKRLQKYGLITDEDPKLFCLMAIKNSSEISLTHENRKEIKAIFKVYYIIFSIMKGSGQVWDPI